MLLSPQLLVKRIEFRIGYKKLQLSINKMIGASDNLMNIIAKELASKNETLIQKCNLTEVLEVVKINRYVAFISRDLSTLLLYAIMGSEKNPHEGNVLARALCVYTYGFLDKLSFTKQLNLFLESIPSYGGAASVKEQLRKLNKHKDMYIKKYDHLRNNSIAHINQELLDTIYNEVPPFEIINDTTALLNIIAGLTDLITSYLNEQTNRLNAQQPAR